MTAKKLKIEYYKPDPDVQCYELIHKRKVSTRVGVAQDAGCFAGALKERVNDFLTWSGEPETDDF